MLTMTTALILASVVFGLWTAGLAWDHVADKRSRDALRAQRYPHLSKAEFRALDRKWGRSARRALRLQRNPETDGWPGALLYALVISACIVLLFSR